jgi:opacity protein-like surface antigen
MKHIMIGLCATLLATTSSFAADFYQPEPAPFIDAPEIQVKEASGWYLRGDVGYSLNKLRGAHYYQGASTSSGMTDFHRAKLGNEYMGGVGVGYQVNNYLRTDLTFDYMSGAKFKGSTKGYCGLGSGTVACTSSDYTSMRAFALMANAYVDLGTYGRFTPYVGAGIGGAHVNWKNLKNTSCPDAGGTCDPTTWHGGKGNWRFSYALMAGATIDINCHLKADVGYRMRYINGGNMFGYANNGGPGRDKGLYSHEARVGARYNFNGCDTALLSEPVDIPVQPLKL